MLGFIFRKAQATVDDAIEGAIESVVNGIIVAVPFILALAFAIAALAGWLHEMFAPVTANLILAFLFAAAGGIAAAVVHVRSAPDPIEDGADLDTRLVDEELTGSQSGFGSIGGADRETVMAALTTALPIALPVVARNWTRILPIVLALAVAAFVILRMSKPGEGTAVPAMQPAE